VAGFQPASQAMAGGGTVVAGMPSQPLANVAGMVLSGGLLAWREMAGSPITIIQLEWYD